MTGAIWLLSFLTPASQSLGATLTLTANADPSWWLATFPDQETPLVEVTALPLSSLSLNSLAEVKTGTSPIDLMADNSSAPLFNFSTSRLTSSNRDLSLPSVISSLSQLRWDLDRKNAKIEVPRLSQTTIADIYKDVYEFRASSAGNGNQSGSADSFEFLIPFFPLRNARLSAGGRVSLGDLPRFGGPLSFLTSPGLVAAGPRRPVTGPSLNAPKAGALDSEVNVTLPSQPKTEVEDVDTFLRTTYRTQVSDMLERINKSLKTKVDVNLRLMPQPVFSNPYQPHSSSSYYNPPTSTERTALPQPLPGLPNP